MNVIKQLRETSGLPYLCLERLSEKDSRRERRIMAKVSSNWYSGKKTHWANRTGRYKDEELRKGPKYWHGQRPVRINNSIKSYQDLRIAIELIASGDKHYDNYKGVSRINREKLRAAQLWKNEEINYSIADIVRLNTSEIKEEFQRRVRLNSNRGVYIS